MTLREWIANQRLTQREAAERLGVHEITLNRWVNEKATPRRKQMSRVQTATDGAVQPRDFFPATATAA